MRYIFLAIALLICTNAQAQIIRAEPFYVAPEEAAAPSGDLLLDSFPGAAVAYSLRKLDKDYTGSAIRVRRSSDNTEQDIGFVNNYLDTAAMKTFVGANDGFVVTWYNQADSSGIFGIMNATQATAASQPQIINTGEIIYEGGEVALDFQVSANDDQLNFFLPSFNLNSLSILTVSKSDISPSGAGIALSIPSTTNRIHHHFYNSTNLYYGYNSATAFTHSGGSNQNVNLIQLYAGSSNAIACRNSICENSISSVNAALTNVTWSIGTFTTFWFNGKIQEVLLYKSDKTSDRTSISNNINAFYSIY